MTGKDAIKNIAALRKEAEKAVKDADKAKASLAKAIEKFPKKEVELYAEKLEKFKTLDL